MTRSVPPLLRTIWGAPLLLLASAFAIRAWQFGNPVIHIDEQFYLLVGDRLWQGRGLPFVDFWDRKPFGLFLIYAAIRAIGSQAVIAYQVVATICAAATACLVRQLAGRIAGASAAVLAGLAYLVYLSVNGGDGGQSPVFYNLPVALAALLVVRAHERPRFDRRAIVAATTAMALFGIALQIKYSVLFEGLFFGLALLVRARRLAVLQWVALALAWCMVALLPTALVAAFYWRYGALDALVFANFQSVFLRVRPEPALMAERLALIALHLAPLLLMAAIGLRTVWRQRPTGRLLLRWAGASIGGLIVFGTYFDHYALPLVLPLAVVAAPALALPLPLPLPRTRRLIPAAIPILGVGLLYVAVNTAILHHTRGNGEGAHRLAAAIGHRPKDCLFVFSGDPILYHLTDACVPTAYNFTTFLSEMGDSRTLGIDPHAELRRAMATRPAFVVISSVDPGATDVAARDYVMDILGREYRLVDRSILSERVDQLYRRNTP